MNNKGNIGGWLILMGLQIAVTILISLKSVVIYIQFFQSPEWLNISNISYGKSYETLFLYETALYICLLVSSLFILAVFILKKRRFRDVYSVYMVLCILAYLGAYLIASRIETLPNKKLHELDRAILSYTIWSVIWIRYLFKAKRPQTTFVN
jgi:hypothetical protein